MPLMCSRRCASRSITRLSISGSRRCLRLDAKQFAAVPDISIDYALMERSERVATVPCDIGWSDIGSWNAMGELTAADASGNRLEGEVLVHGAHNNYVQSPERLTALVGVEDLIVVDTPDAVLVAHKDHAQDVKHIVSQLKKSGHDAHLMHRTVHRPWVPTPPWKRVSASRSSVSSSSRVPPCRYRCTIIVASTGS